MAGLDADKCFFKESYETREGAERTLARVSKILPVRSVYKCPLCGFYHLTKKKNKPRETPFSHIEIEAEHWLQRLNVTEYE